MYIFHKLFPCYEERMAVMAMVAKRHQNNETTLELVCK